MKVHSIVLGVILIALALFAWAWAFAGEPPAVGEIHRSPPAQPQGQASPVGAPIERRDAVAIEPAAESKAEAEVAADTAPARVPPFLARFQVVNEDDQPVADAVVTVWAAKRPARSPQMEKAAGSKGNSYSGRSKTPLLELHTDVQGRAQARLEVECVVASASKGDLSTGEYTLWNTRAAERETKFVLETQLLLRGIVLHADGRPAGGVRIVAQISGASILQRGRAQAPEPVDSGPDGRFALPVRAHVGYSLQGELGGMRTFRESARVHPPRNDEIVMRFPGGITIDGVIVDASGQPVAKAGVTAWREYPGDDPKQDFRGFEREYAKVGLGGRFSMPVRRHARYQVVASDGVHANSCATWVETTPERPHVDVRLVLPEFATIKGRVVRGDGSAFPRVVVGALPGLAETSNGMALPSQQELFGKVTNVTTSDDGGFVLVVHPGAPWTVRAMPDKDNRRLVFEEKGVRAGREDVEVRIGDRELAGCTVHGTVTRAGGQSVGPFRVEAFVWEDDQLSLDGGDCRARIDGDAFTVSALPLGRRFALLVTPACGDQFAARHELLAPAQTAPFVTDRAEIALNVRVEEWGRCNVQVLNDKGLPVRGVRVVALRVPQLGSPTGGPVDADGRNAVWCAPGPHRLQVWTTGEKLTDQDLLLTSGINPDVVVRLPAGAATGR
jgi:protocatechuate 3,4-dioxygenase beta subunit